MTATAATTVLAVILEVVLVVDVEGWLPEAVVAEGRCGQALALSAAARQEPTTTVTAATTVVVAVAGVVLVVAVAHCRSEAAEVEQRRGEVRQSGVADATTMTATAVTTTLVGALVGVLRLHAAEVAVARPTTVKAARSGGAVVVVRPVAPATLAQCSTAWSAAGSRLLRIRLSTCVLVVAAARGVAPRRVGVLPPLTLVVHLLHRQRIQTRRRLVTTTGRRGGRGNDSKLGSDGVVAL